MNSDIVSNCGKTFLQGIKDSISFHLVISYFYSSPHIRRRALQSSLLNGGLFCGSIIFLQYIWIPLFEYVWFLCGFHEHTIHFMIQWMSFCFDICWFYPLYAISFLLSSMWYQDIATSALTMQNSLTYKSFHTPANPVNIPSFSFKQWISSISEDLYRLLIGILFMIQGILWSYCPWIGTFVFSAHVCWLYAWYAFEYKWGGQAWTFAQRIDYFECHWCYFAGFGCPLTIVTMCLSGFLGASLYAFLFPIVLLLAIMAQPRPVYFKSSSSVNTRVQNMNCPSPILFRLPLFSSCVIVMNAALGRFRKTCMKNIHV
ncbi:MAG: hypothetical protein Sylvanvirus32_3 [Sylvanvirus sp.]|uniref:Etoposide-induced protein 2.4 n=1 Tax=Sylvanvirus sp. TaxID=2487774 RepID=A0A3G5AMD0_9VIRU|nr:MAG: hypothetical protein Sylvanvirus32_3 [Sylvanvirus sp.]